MKSATDGHKVYCVARDNICQGLGKTMRKKLVASGIILLVLGVVLIVIPKQDATYIDTTLLNIAGHVIGAIETVLAVVGFGTILADRL